MATQKQKEAIKQIKGTFNQFPDHWQYIYVIRCIDYYKIGISYDLDNRLNSLQTGNPFELEIIYATRIPNAKMTEEKLHERFKDFKHYREWFKLDVQNIDFSEEIKKIWQQ